MQGLQISNFVGMVGPRSKVQGFQKSGFRTALDLGPWTLDCRIASGLAPQPLDDSLPPRHPLRCNDFDGSDACPSISPEPVAALLAEEEPIPLPSGICTSLNVEAPQHPYQSPPGFHFLYIVDNGVPSKAKIVQLKACP